VECPGQHYRAIAQADILGIFGQQSLDYGTLWGSRAYRSGAFAFKIFLNYDGMAISSARPAFGNEQRPGYSFHLRRATRGLGLDRAGAEQDRGDIGDSIGLATSRRRARRRFGNTAGESERHCAQTSDINISGNSLTATFRLIP